MQHLHQRWVIAVPACKVSELALRRKWKRAETSSSMSRLLIFGKSIIEIHSLILTDVFKISTDVWLMLHHSKVYWQFCLSTCNKQIYFLTLPFWMHIWKGRFGSANSSIINPQSCDFITRDHTYFLILVRVVTYLVEIPNIIFGVDILLQYLDNFLLTAG